MQLQEEAKDYYAKWLNEDVLYIIGNEERAVFQKLTTAEEKEQFIEQFWHRRDPDPRTAYNEFKEEHYRRIAYANEHYTSGDRGWQTDRGRVYIIYGQPESIESRPTGGAYVRSLQEGGGTTSVFPYEKWRYKYIEGLGQDIEIEFVDSTYTGKFQLAVFPWEKDALTHSPGAGKTLAEQIGMSTRAERPGFIPAAGGAGYGPQQLFASRLDTPFARYELNARIQAPPVVKYTDLKELVKVNINYVNLPFELRMDYFRLNESQTLIPITLQVKNSDLMFEPLGDVQMARVAVYGLVTSMTNQVITEFEDDFSVGYQPQFLDEGRGKLAMFQKILTLDRSRRYRLDLIVKDLNSGHVGVIRTGILPPGGAVEQLQTSSMVLSSLIQPLGTVPETVEMFVLGDVKVLPNMQKRFTTQMPLGVYLQIYNAAFDQASLSPSLQVHYRLWKDGELLKEAADENGESVQFFSGQRVVLIKQMSLDGLIPGPYEVEVAVVDQITARHISSREQFSVIEVSQLASKN